MGGSNKSYQAAGEKRNYLKGPVVHVIISPAHPQNNGKVSAKGSGRIWTSALVNKKEFRFLRALTSQQPCATEEMGHKEMSDLSMVTAGRRPLTTGSLHSLFLLTNPTHSCGHQIYPVFLIKGEIH